MPTEKKMTDLEKIFYENQGFMINKFSHCIPIYDHYLSKFRGKEVVILEMGVGNGGSLFMWKNYLGPKAKVFGADAHGYLGVLSDPQIHTFQGNFENIEFIRQIRDHIPPIDILIDDGSHHPPHQRAIFEELMPHLKDEGLYFCEDLQTSFSEEWGGGYHKPESFIEHLKNFLDYQYGFYLEDDPICVDLFQNKYIFAMHFYPYMVVIEKSKERYQSLRSPVTTGTVSII